MGEYGARLLAANFRSLEDLCRVDAKKVQDIKQVGETIADAVATFFGDEGNIETFGTLKSLGVVLENPDFASAGAAGRGALAGMTFVITGTLPEARSKVEELIERHGGRPITQVSAATDYLIAGENPGSKLAKAEKLGVKRITYEELVRMVGERG